MKLKTIVKDFSREVNLLWVRVCEIENLTVFLESRKFKLFSIDLKFKQQFRIYLPFQMIKHSNSLTNNYLRYIFPLNPNQFHIVH